MGCLSHRVRKWHPGFRLRVSSPKSGLVAQTWPIRLKLGKARPLSFWGLGVWNVKVRLLVAVILAQRAADLRAWHQREAKMRGPWGEMGFEFLDRAIPLPSLHLGIRANTCPPELRLAWITSLVPVMSVPMNAVMRRISTVNMMEGEPKNWVSVPTAPGTSI